MEAYPEDTILCLKTGRTAQIQQIEESKPSTYADQWFSEHKSKPTLNLSANDSGTKVEILRELIYSKIGSTLQIEIVVEFLHHVLLETRENLTSVWKSYGVPIGNEGQISNTPRTSEI